MLAVVLLVSLWQSSMVTLLFDDTDVVDRVFIIAISSSLQLFVLILLCQGLYL